jgi:hypothetical protein
MEKARQIKNAAAAEMRVMQKPRRLPEMGRKADLHVTGSARTAKARAGFTIRRSKTAF